MLFTTYNFKLITEDRVNSQMAVLKHGGDIKSFAEKSGKPEQEICDFSSNVNPLGISSSMAQVYRDALPEISRYPDSYARELCHEISRHFLVFPENVIVGNGAVSLIELSIRLLKPQRALLVEPCFTEYRRMLQIHGVEVFSILLREHDDFRFSLSEIVSSLDHVDLMVVSHPNNPTGTALSRVELLSLIREAERRNVFLLIDQAFVDWCPDLSISNEVKDSARFIVFQSMTKFYGLAGLRSGFALGAREAIEKMRSLQEPWSCNVLAQRLSIAALQDERYRRKTLDWFRSESQWFHEELSKTPGVKIFPSLTNFYLAKLFEVGMEKQFWKTMTDHGIYLREGRDFTGLNERFFRVALRLRKENEWFLQNLRVALGRRGGPIPPYNAADSPRFLTEYPTDGPKGAGRPPTCSKTALQ